jgi:hypothetical protein
VEQTGFISPNPAGGGRREIGNGLGVGVLFEQHAADIYIREIGLHNRLQLSIYCYA